MKNFPYKSVINKYLILCSLLTLVGIMIVAKAGYLMFGQRELWKARADKCVRSGVPVPVSRGDIIAADGQLLATYVPEYKIFLDYTINHDSKKMKDSLQLKKDTTFLLAIDSIAEGLNRVLPEKSVEWYHNRLMEGFNQKSKHWLIYPRRISYLDYKELKKVPFLCRSTSFSGFHTELFNRIDKPFGSLAARTLGDVDRETGHGINGLQYKFDSILSGKPGLGHRIKVRNSHITIIDEEPVAGANLHTTLDVNMQDFCENALVEKLKEINGIYGVAVLMEVQTGDIKAMVNMERSDDGVYRDVLNYAVSRAMQPGSVFKTISLTAALEAGKVDLNTTVDCSAGAITVGGHTIKDASHKSNKVISLREVLGYSSNVGVIKLITKGYGGSRESEQQFCDDVLKLGLAEDFDLDIDGYTGPKIHSPKTLGEYWSASTMASMSIGYSSEVPPICLLAFYNGLANGGRMMRPRLVTRIVREGEVIKDIPPRAIKEHMCSQKTARDITECLKWVVSDGLGGAAGSPNFLVAGKTGTARVQVPGHEGEYLVTFCGFFPADNPKYSCVVSMRKAGSGSGGGMCGPVFKQIAEFVMAQGNKSSIHTNIDSIHALPPSLDFTNLLYADRALNELGFITPMNWNKQNQPYPLGQISINNQHANMQSLTVKKNTMPNLTGMGPRDALFLLEKMHLRVKLQGTGKVLSQSLPEGHVIQRGETVVLTLGCRNAPKKPEPVVAPADSLKAPSSDTLNKQAPVTNNSTTTTA